MLENYKLHNFNFNREVSYVYILYRKFEIVYIGMTKRLDQRLFTHLRDKRFESAKYIIVSHEEAPALEKALIAYYKPLYNSTFKGEPKPKKAIKIKYMGYKVDPEPVYEERGIDDYILELSQRGYKLSDLMQLSEKFDVNLKSISDRLKAIIKRKL